MDWIERHTTPLDQLTNDELDAELAYSDAAGADLLFFAAGIFGAWCVIAGAPLARPAGLLILVLAIATPIF